jgi:hypothetical protein
MNQKDNSMKYTAFCGGEKMDNVQHALKNSVSIFVE